MRQIIFGILFIIGGLSGQLALRGTNSSGALVAVGAVFLIIGIVRFINAGDEEEVVITKKTADCIAKDGKITVYNKTHESLGVLTEIEGGTKFTLDFTTDYDRFYKVMLANGQTGYILKKSGFAELPVGVSS